MKVRGFLVLVAVTMLPCPPALASLAAGVKALERRDFETARRHLDPLASAGDATAQLLIGRLYIAAIDRPQDTAKAADLFRLSAAQGNDEAAVELARMMLSGEVPGAEISEAVALYMEAADRGHGPAEYDLGLLYQEGRFVSKDGPEAMRWFSRCAARGNATCELGLANAYALGQGIESNQAEATRWLRAAADHGHPEAMFRLGQMLLERPEDTDNAIALLEQAEEKDQLDARRLLAQLYLSGDHVAQDLERAFFLATRLRCDDETLSLVRRALEPATPKQRKALTRKTLQLARGEYGEAYPAIDALAHLGIETAQLRLGAFLASAYGRPQNLPEAYKWLRLGAAADRATAKLLTREVAKRLDPAQVEALDRLVDEWKPAFRETCAQKPRICLNEADVAAGLLSVRNLCPAWLGGCNQPPLRLKKVAPPYPEQARRSGQQSQVDVDAVISTTGEVLDLCVVRSEVPGKGFEEAALWAVNQWKYEPARMANGAPVEVVFRVYVLFELRR